LIRYAHKAFHVYGIKLGTTRMPVLEQKRGRKRDMQVTVGTANAAVHGNMGGHPFQFIRGAYDHWLLARGKSAKLPG
jgi:hypothetical protein